MVLKLSLVAAALVSLPAAFAGHIASGAALPQYWKDRADEFGIDHNALAFNINESMWYYNGVSTCIGWGEFDEMCDFDTRVCAGYNGHSYGYGTQQMMEIKSMIDMGAMQHELCPVCPNAPASETFVCHDGIKYAMPSGQVQNDFGLPGHMSLLGRGIWMTCDCREVHRGKDLAPGTYWFNAAEAAGLDGTLVSWLNGVWYYDDKYSCVAKGPAMGACDNVVLLCAGGMGDKFGYGAQQMAELAAAAALPTREHAYCPLP